MSGRRAPTTLRVRRRLAAEDGFSAGAEVMIVGSLVFLTAWVICLNAWNVLATDMAVTAASREAVRTYVESTGSSGEAHSRGVAAGQQAAQNMGRANVAVAFSAESALVRCQRVTATSTATIDRLRIPFIGGVGGSMSVSDSHSERVDPFRSGLPGTAGCAG